MRNRRNGWVAVAAILSCLWTAGTARAQSDATPAIEATWLRGAVLGQEPLAPGATQPPPVRHTGFRTLVGDIGGDFRHLLSKDAAIWSAVGAGTALALHPLDDDLNEKMAGSDTAVFAPGRVIGYGAVQIGAAVGTWAIGRAVDKRGRVAHLGLDLLRAQIVTQSITYGLKYSVRRERPDGSSGYAMPSGHASTTFATATVLARHLGWKAAVPTYAVATYVAASRLHDNRHYLSDVIVGATLGVVAGRTVTRHGKSDYAMVPLPGPGVVGVAFTHTGP